MQYLKKIKKKLIGEFKNYKYNNRKFDFFNFNLNYKYIYK